MFNLQDFKRIQDKASTLQAERQYLIKELRIEREKEAKWSKRHGDCLKGRAVIQEAAKATQVNLERRIGDLVTTALEGVFPDDPYEFRLKFEVRRNRTECDIWFVKNGKEMDPMLDSGGGPKDVASFAARLAFWSLRKSRPLVILDEPFKFLHSPEYQRNCSDMIGMLSEKLGMQMLIVTDQRNIEGDRIFDLEEM